MKKLLTFLLFLLLCATPASAQTITPTPNPTPDPAKLPGLYSVVSIDPDGKTKQGSLKLSADGKLQFRAEWTFEDSKTEGLALLADDELSIVDGPAGCRLYMYKLDSLPTRSFTGRYTTIGLQTPQDTLKFVAISLVGTPTAPNQQQSNVAGIYSDGGRGFPDNRIVELGQLIITDQKDYLQFFWTQGATTFTGVGLTDQKFIGATAAMIPKIACNLTLLHINDDETLEGSSIRTDQTAVNTVSAERIKDN